MAWLLNQVQRANCVIQQMKLSGLLKDQEAQLKQAFGVDIIVNCTGLGAIELTNDRLYPLRGALVRVHNDGRATPPITKAHCVAFSGSQNTQDMIFIVPRGRDMLLLGGLVQPHEWDLAISLENYQPVRDMLERCKEFLPQLRTVQLDVNEPVRVGLRPFRAEGVRVEHEPGTCIIHNYGHGGSGVTFSWGCALEVVAIANTLGGLGSVSQFSQWWPDRVRHDRASH